MRIMSNEEKKARELVEKFENVTRPLFKDSKVLTHIHPEHAKQCAIIAVDLVLDNLEDHTGEEIKCWQEIKRIIKEEL